MSETTSVPQPTIGLTGVLLPAESAVLAGRQSDIDAAFGGGLDQSLTTPQGQLVSSEAAIIGDCFATFLALANAFDPAYSSGRFQDALGRIYFQTRIPAQSTVVQCACVGAVGTVIPTGATAQDTGGNTYVCVAGGTIGATGSLTLSFANAATGPIPCAAGTLTSIYQTVPGWDTITNPADGVLGNLVESRYAFEQRRQQSVAANARDTNAAIQAALLATSGVLDAYVVSNNTSGSLTIGGVAVPANSIYASVSGGTATAIAAAIFSKKPPGIPTFGPSSSTVTVTSGYVVPYPTYPINFNIAIPTDVLFAVSIVNSVGVPSNATTLVQNAIISAFAGGDGGPRARIGGTIYATRFVSAIAALGSWAQVISIQIGTGTANANSVLLPINEVPVVSASDIAVTYV